MRDQAARFLEQYFRESLGSRHPALTILRRLSAQVHSGHLNISIGHLLEPRFNIVLFRWTTWPRSLEMESVAFEKSSLSSWRMIFHLSRFHSNSYHCLMLSLVVQVNRLITMNFLQVTQSGLVPSLLAYLTRFTMTYDKAHITTSEISKHRLRNECPLSTHN